VRAVKPRPLRALFAAPIYHLSSQPAPRQRRWPRAQ